MEMDQNALVSETLLHIKYIFDKYRLGLMKSKKSMSLSDILGWPKHHKIVGRTRWLLTHAVYKISKMIDSPNND